MSLFSGYFTFVLVLHWWCPLLFQCTAETWASDDEDDDDDGMTKDDLSSWAYRYIDKALQVVNTIKMLLTERIN